MVEDASTVIHWARAYDVLVGVLTLGRERRFRTGLVDLVHLRPGEAVLDERSAGSTRRRR